jgi:polysaccharide biosynthesis protein PelG
MAGIGFKLERMTQECSLSLTVGAYLYAAFLIAGPWIFTILGITGISLAACDTCNTVKIFRSIIIYNSVFSFILVNPIAYVCTRFISDRVFIKRYESITFALVTALILFSVLAMPIAGPFYFFMTTLTTLEKLASLQNLMLVGASWLLMQFVGAMRTFTTVSSAFALGAAAMTIMVVLAFDSTPFWLLNSFDFGLCVTDAVLVWRMTREYGLRLSANLELFQTAFTYWELPLIGLTYSIGIWIDKLIMWWAAPGTVRVASALQTMPDYDTPMFWAQLAALPVIAVFFVHVEPNFFRLCRGFYGRVQEHASLRELEQSMFRLGRFALASVITLFVALAAIAAMAIATSFVGVDLLGLRPTQMGIFRNAMVGMACHASFMFCFIFFLYFDLRRPALALSTIFLVLNGALTAAFLPLGFTFFAYGNMLASVITFVAAVALLTRELPWLHFHAFITTNQCLMWRPPLVGKRRFFAKLARAPQLPP